MKQIFEYFLNPHVQLKQAQNGTILKTYFIMFYEIAYKVEIICKIWKIDEILRYKRTRSFKLKIILTNEISSKMKRFL